MNIKFLSFIVLFTVCFSCKKNQEESVNATVNESIKQDISKNDISNLDYVEYILDEKAETIIEDWQEYAEFNDIVANVKTGDLSFFIDNDDVIKTLFKNLKAEMPSTLIIPSITARMLALETKFLKLKSISNLSNISKEDVNVVIKEFLESFSYFNLQMNKKIEDDSQNIEKP